MRLSKNILSKSTTTIFHIDTSPKNAGFLLDQSSQLKGGEKTKMKKLLRSIVAVALILVVATPAFAYQRNYYRSGNTTTNFAMVDSGIITSANTGENVQGNSVMGSAPVEQVSLTRNFGWHYPTRTNDVAVMGNNILTTGDAHAITNNNIIANSNDCGCVTPSYRTRYQTGSTTVLNSAMVKSGIQTTANTGYNGQGNYITGSVGSSDVFVGGDNTATTGEAHATTNSTIVVNSQWSM